VAVHDKLDHEIGGLITCGYRVSGITDITSTLFSADGKRLDESRFHAHYTGSIRAGSLYLDYDETFPIPWSIGKT
jgi:hypothetical protein